MADQVLEYLRDNGTKVQVSGTVLTTDPEGQTWHHDYDLEVELPKLFAEACFLLAKGPRR